MGEKKVQCHNPGLLPVPGRLLLSLFSGKIPNKEASRIEVCLSFEKHSSFPDIKYSFCFLGNNFDFWWEFTQYDGV